MLAGFWLDAAALVTACIAAAAAAVAAAAAAFTVALGCSHLSCPHAATWSFLMHCSPRLTHPYSPTVQLEDRAT